MKTISTKTITIFIALVIAGICLIVFGQDATDSAVRNVLSLVGTALFTAGLTYFLVKAG
jgi:hypothetical protein